MAPISILQRIIGWIRAGYPEGISERDYIPLLALLGRRLSEVDLEQVADELAESGQLTSADNSAEVVRRAISRATRAPVDELAVARVQERLRSAGWDLDDLPSS